MWETWVRSLGWEDPLEKEMAAHSSILAWKIPWTEEPGRLQSMGSQRVRQDQRLHFTSLLLYRLYIFFFFKFKHCTTSKYHSGAQKIQRAIFLKIYISVFVPLKLFIKCIHAQSLSCVLILCDPMDAVAHQASSSMGFFRQECWSGLPFPPPRDCLIKQVFPIQ